MSRQDYIILPLLMSDFSEIQAIELAGQKDPWPDAQLLSELTNEHAFHFGARSVQDGALAAFILARLFLDELHIHNVCTHPSCRRRGLGRSLLLHTLETARSRNVTKAFLEVAAPNIGAVSLYRAAGFIVDFVRRGYYAAGEDALVMSAKLA